MSSPFIIIDEISQKITDLVGAKDSNPSVTTAGNAVTKTETINQKLNQISTYQIGSKGDTGGSTTAGSVMAKLNKIIGDIGTVITNIGTVNTAITGLSNTLGNGTYGLSKIQELVSTNNSPDINGILSKKLSAIIPYVVVPVGGNTYTKATIISSKTSLSAPTGSGYYSVNVYKGNSSDTADRLASGCWMVNKSYGSFKCDVSGNYTFSVTGYRETTGNQFIFLSESDNLINNYSSGESRMLGYKYVTINSTSSTTVTANIDLIGGKTYYLWAALSSGTANYAMYISNAKVTYSIMNSI